MSEEIQIIAWQYEEMDERKGVVPDHSKEQVSTGIKEEALIKLQDVIDALNQAFYGDFNKESDIKTLEQMHEDVHSIIEQLEELPTASSGSCEED